jgi:hypothetical protein
MPWQRGQSGNPRGRPVGRVSPRVRGEFALREYLEERLLEHRDAIDDTIARIVRSPRQLPRLLTLYGRLSGELQPPIALILARERQARLDEQARFWRERDALREAQWAAEDAAELEDDTPDPEDELHQDEVAPLPVSVPPPPPPYGGWRPVSDAPAPSPSRAVDRPDTGADGAGCHPLLGGRRHREDPGDDGPGRGSEEGANGRAFLAGTFWET